MKIETKIVKQPKSFDIMGLTKSEYLAIMCAVADISGKDSRIKARAGYDESLDTAVIYDLHERLHGAWKDATS